MTESASSATGLTAFLRRLAAVFGSALILMFFSEYFFFNEGPVETLTDLLAESPVRAALSLLEFSLFYALFAYIMLIALAHYDVRSLRGLFLVGALFGWATEGLIIPVVYEAVPVSIIFPSVSWHALVDVLLGWYAVRALMRRDRPLLSTLTFAGLGAVWAAWSTWFWAEPDSLAPLTPETFAGYALLTALAWIGGMLLLDFAGRGPFAPSKWEVRVVLGLALLLGIGMAVPFLPFSLVLVAVVALTLWALQRAARQPTPARDILEPLQTTTPRWWNYLLALLTPLTAALVYPAFYESGAGIPTEDITFLLLVVGTVLLAWVLVRPYDRSAVPAHDDTPSLSRASE